MTATTAAKAPKITYSAISADMGEIHKSFDAALSDLRGKLGAEHHLYINGAWVKGGGETLQSLSPIDRGWKVGSFTGATPTQVDDAVKAAKNARAAWAGMPWRERVAIMRRAAEKIREMRFEIAAVMTVEIGKNRMESLGDAEESADLIDYYADQVEHADGFVRPLGKLAPNEQTQDVLRPYGVFAVISPFNFPMALATGMSSAALVAGNTVVFKPAGLALLTGEMLARAYAAAGMPAGVFNLLYGSGSSVGEQLVQHADIDGIAFTGSQEVGMRLMREFGSGGPFAKPILGELGGKNAAIVAASADLDMAADGVMRSAFGLQGQKCSACSRVYVHESVAERFLELLKEKTLKLAIGDPTDKNIYMGPVISESAVRTFEESVKSAKSGGEILTGGSRLREGKLAAGLYVEPTVAKLPLDHELFARELFLPFLAVGVVRSFDQALHESNKVNLGLTGGLFSADETEVARFFDEMEAGVLYVNRRTGATTGAWPGVQSFTGWKGSGITGKGGCGPYYVSQFLREQSRTRMT
jgi:1-pyrroline-5-carboxylate dehydrogenase